MAVVGALPKISTLKTGEKIGPFSFPFSDIPEVVDSHIDRDCSIHWDAPFIGL